MTDRRWYIAAGIGWLFLTLLFGWEMHNIGYARGHVAGFNARKAEADRRVHVARAECRELLANQRAWYEGLHDRASVVWKESTAALLRDMTNYERDLEGCLGRRRR